MHDVRRFKWTLQSRESCMPSVSAYRSFSQLGRQSGFVVARTSATRTAELYRLSVFTVFR